MPMAFPITVLMAAVLAGAIEPPSLPIAEAQKVTDTGACYEIEGEITAGPCVWWYAVRDESGVMVVRNWTAPWKVGDVVRMTIEMDKTKTDSPGYVRQIARKSTVIAHRDPPPPVEVLPGQVNRGRIVPYSRVVLHGTVTSILPDEIDADWTFLIVEDEGEQAVVSLYRPKCTDRSDLSHLVDAEVKVRGVFLGQSSGGRQYMGQNVQTYGTNDISIVRAAPADPFAASSPLSLAWPMNTAEAADGHRRRVSGTVLARWMGGNFVLKTDDGHPITVKMPQGQTLPKVGTRVEVVGFVRRTPFTIKLSNALWRLIGNGRATEPPIDVDAPHLFPCEDGTPVINIRYHGRLVRLAGTVVDVLARDSPEQILSLNCDGKPLLAVAEGVPPPTLGSVVEVTGVCIANEKPDDDDLTRLSGLSVVMRSADDLRIIKSPPWWTAKRLLMVIGVLFALIVASVLWVYQLNRVVERKSRELRKEQMAHFDSEARIGERTRLAVELHDSLSQSLAALSFQLSSARTAKAEGLDAAEGKHLATAEKMLDSCRAELRHCLLDLRSDMLEEQDFATAILKTLRADAADAEIEIDFKGERSQMSDSVAHASLMIIRELVSNAIRHGHAGQIKIEGDAKGGSLTFSVTDDGLGFDVDSYPGLNDGHFGLAGIHQRVKNLCGEFLLRSTKGEGTTASVTFKL